MSELSSSPLQRTVLAACAAGALIVSNGQAQSPPNVILVLADDLGFGDLGPYDHDSDPATPDVTNTPVLDQFAAQGARLATHYDTASVCTPTRAALLTGRYSVRAHVSGVLIPNDPHGLAASEVTIADVLRERGYRSGAVGKWHLGDHAEFHPLHQSFERFFGVPYSNDMTPFYLESDTTIVEVEPDQGMLTKRFFDAGRVFVRQAAADPRPFFLYLPITMPHVPVYVSAQFDGATGRGLYADCIREIDARFGELLQELEDDGLAQNTVVIFTSDNGPWNNTHLPPPGSPDHWRWVGGSSGGLRGSKATFFDGGLRVPCLVRWPDGIPAGSVVSETTSCLDFLPTLAALAGATLPTSLRIDGRNLLPRLTQAASLEPTDLFFTQNIGNGPDWGECRVAALRHGRWKALLSPSLEPFLVFDLALDPGETTPISFAEIGPTLRDLASSFQCTVDAPPPVPGADPNLARRRATLASSSVGSQPSAYAVDGQSTTLWRTNATELQWIRVDLGMARRVGRVGLQFGADYAREYELQASLDGSTWNSVYRETHGGGAPDARTMDVMARYLRLDLVRSRSGTGYTLAEMRVVGVDSGHGGHPGRSVGPH